MELHFIRPWFLLFLPIAMVLIYYCHRNSSTISSWHEICDPHLLKHQLVGRQSKHAKIPRLLLFLICLLSALALSGPSLEKLPLPVFNNNQSRVLVLDLSKSMNATDITPSRLARAKFKLIDLINATEDIPQGLVVFAGDAFVVTPITDDKNTLLNLVNTLNSKTMPIQGSRLDLGLLKATELLKNTLTGRGTIIAITDGGPESILAIAKQIKSQGFSISILATGTEKGSPIPTLTDGLLKNAAGEVIISKVDHHLLESLAKVGNGSYTPITATNTDIALLTKASRTPLSLSQHTRENTQNGLFKADQHKDLGPWLMFPLLLLSALTFKKGWLISIVLLMPFFPQPAQAIQWQDLWLRSDQKAAKYFAKKEYTRIDQTAPYAWQAASRYKENDFESVIDLYQNQKKLTTIEHYNLGNALAKTGNYDQAIQAYEQALATRENFPDAEFNKTLIEKLLQQQKETENTSQNNKNQITQQQKESEKQENQTTAQQQDDTQDTSNTHQKNTEPGNKYDQPATTRATQTKEKQSSNQETMPFDQSTTLSTTSEETQALQQWLQQIPDQPGSLLKRKFAQQYALRNPKPNSTTQTQTW